MEYDFLIVDNSSTEKVLECAREWSDAHFGGQELAFCMFDVVQKDSTVYLLTFSYGNIRRLAEEVLSHNGIKTLGNESHHFWWLRFYGRYPPAHEVRKYIERKAL